MAVVCRAIRQKVPQCGIEHRIIHTGQHYDHEMSAVFFSELDIPDPDAHLGVGSGSHGEQTGEMLKRLESVLSQQRPDCVLLYGDTNSTLAGAIACAKLHIPAAHVEAGLRSFNRRMPEEIDGLVADQLSELLFATTSKAMRNLGMGSRAILSGDIMYDASLCYSQLAEARGGPIAERFAPPKLRVGHHPSRREHRRPAAVARHSFRA